jgi:hypothetical protein
MPYKDPEKRRECRRRWYHNNRESEIKHITDRKKYIRKWFEIYKKQLKCSNCDENHPATLEFHHQKDKENAIGNLVYDGYSIRHIKKEIEKCIVLCANCHRKIHFLDKS